MELLVIGIATAFNLIIIKVKIELRRYLDAILDLGVLATLSLVFGGSFAGLVTATISSAIISIYLLLSPPRIISHSVSLTSTKRATQL